MSLLTVVSVFLLSTVAITSAINNLNDELFSDKYEFIDLTHPFDNDTVYWPTEKNFIFTKKIAKFQEDGSWYSSNEFAAGEHGGTHIDAPYHFDLPGKYVGDIPLEKLILPLIIIDISSRVNDDPNFVLYKEHLDYVINNNLGKPCILLVKFGWSKHFHDPKYLGYDEKTKTLKFPGLSAEVAEWITTSYKNVVGVGVDVASVDPGSSTDYPVHKTFAKAGLYNMENVNMNRPIPEYGCTALVLPMKIAHGTGAPLRIVAICPKQNPTTF